MKKEERPLCGALAPEDGIDPRILFSKAGRKKAGQRRAKQLCRQVERAVSFYLAGEAGDPILQDLLVLSVSPAPDASRLMIAVCPAVPGADLDKILERLHALRGLLRTAISQEIHRKRTPELAFQVVPADAANPCPPPQNAP